MGSRKPHDVRQGVGSCSKKGPWDQRPHAAYYSAGNKLDSAMGKQRDLALLRRLKECVGHGLFLALNPRSPALSDSCGKGRTDEDQEHNDTQTFPCPDPRLTLHARKQLGVRSGECGPSNMGPNGSVFSAHKRSFSIRGRGSEDWQGKGLSMCRRKASRY
jgi:hypothetical protein